MVEAKAYNTLTFRHRPMPGTLAALGKGSRGHYLLITLSIRI